MSSTDLVQITQAVIAVIGTLGVAALGLVGVIVQARKPSKDKPPTGNTGKALEGFSGTQNEFMSLVIADNKELRAIAEAADRKAERALSEAQETKRHQETFMGAVRRYLMKLATAWTGDEPMPWPDDEDFHILEKTLPHTR